MKGELYRRWLSDDRGLTLAEFVEERRAEVRQRRAQRRMSTMLGPMLQNAAAQQVAFQQGMQGMTQQEWHGVVMRYVDQPFSGMF